MVIISASAHFGFTHDHYAELSHHQNHMIGLAQADWLAPKYQTIFKLYTELSGSYHGSHIRYLCCYTYDPHVQLHLRLVYTNTESPTRI